MPRGGMDAAGHPRCLQGEARIWIALPTSDRPVTAGRMPAPQRASRHPMQAAGRGAASAARPNVTGFRRSAADRAGERRHDAADGTDAHRSRGGPRRATESRGDKTGLEQGTYTRAALPNDPTRGPRAIEIREIRSADPRSGRPEAEPRSRIGGSSDHGSVIPPAAIGPAPRTAPPQRERCPIAPSVSTRNGAPRSRPGRSRASRRGRIHPPQMARARRLHAPEGAILRHKSHIHNSL
jgi:hypothetical protein